AAAFNDRHDQFAILVAERDLGPQQVRSSDIAASQIGAVTARAVDSVQRFAARNLLRVARRPLLPWDKTPGPPASPLRHRTTGKQKPRQHCEYAAVRDPHQFTSNYALYVKSRTRRRRGQRPPCISTRRSNSAFTAR